MRAEDLHDASPLKYFHSAFGRLADATEWDEQFVNLAKVTQDLTNVNWELLKEVVSAE